MALWEAFKAEQAAERAGREFSRLPSDAPEPKCKWSPAMCERCGSTTKCTCS
jgi:hypothetical protein